MASWLVQSFLYSSRQTVPILYNMLPLPPSNLPRRMGQSGPTSNTLFLGHTPKSTSQTTSRSVQPLVLPTDRETDHVLCKILFKSILKIQGKDSLKNYPEDTKIRIASSRYFLQILFRRYFSCISHDISYRVTTTKQSPQILMYYRLLLLMLVTVLLTYHHYSLRPNIFKEISN